MRHILFGLALLLVATAVNGQSSERFSQHDETARLQRQRAGIHLPSAWPVDAVEGQEFHHKGIRGQ